MNAVGAVLAAGASRRLGFPKQLLRLPDHETLVSRSVASVRASSARRCAVVVGADAAAVVASLGGGSVDVIDSEDHREGIAASIRAAAAWADSQQAEALLICVCDQPALEPGHVGSLLEAWERERGLVASLYAGKRGVPAVFPRAYFPELRMLRGDRGAGDILRKAERVSLCEWPEGELDVDTPSDWMRFLAKSS